MRVTKQAASRRYQSHIALRKVASKLRLCCTFMRAMLTSRRWAAAFAEPSTQGVADGYGSWRIIETSLVTTEKNPSITESRG